MRQLSEIKKDIEVIDGKIAALKAQRMVLADEGRERMFADFCLNAYNSPHDGDVHCCNRE